MCPLWTLAARRVPAALLVLAVAAPARAQTYSTLFDTSIRSAAMGGASGAVTWGEPGVWANPATLSGVSGLGWVAGYTDYSNGVVGTKFSSQRLMIGGGGVAFSFMGQPISGFGKARFEIPSDGPFTSSLVDLTEGWSIGLSPLRLFESVRRLGSRPLTSYGDVAFGYQSKSSKATISPPGRVGFEFDEAGTYDWGVTGRLALARWWGADASYRLDLSGAFSQVNSSTSQQIDRTGVALHLSPAPPIERSSSPPSPTWWRPNDVPELSMGLAYDHERQPEAAFGVDHYGLEANVFRLLSLRVGYISYRESGSEGVTYGGGLSLPIGPWGSVGYQFADGFDRQFRQGWSVWIEPTHFRSNGH